MTKLKFSKLYEMSKMKADYFIQRHKGLSDEKI